MTDRSDDHDHRFSEGEGSTTLRRVRSGSAGTGRRPSKVDPVDSRIITDTLDEQNIPSDEVDAGELLDVGLNYMGINRFEQATAAFERAARFADDDRLAQEAWVNKGVAHAELEEYDEAIGAHREALWIDDESEHAATAETNLAYALWEFGETAQALEHAERAVEIDDRFAEGWFNRAFSLGTGLSGGTALYRQRDPPRHAQRKSLEEKARILEDLGEYDEAEEIAEEANEMRERAEQRVMEQREEMHGGTPTSEEVDAGPEREWELE